MRKLTIKLIMGLLLLSSTALAQAKLFVEPRAGYGTFQMEAMKEYQQTLISQSEVNAKATDSFKPHYQFGLGVVYALNERLHTGIFVEQSETGGRVHYEDYSGELRHDLRLYYKAFGLMISTQFPVHDGPFSFVTGFETNLFFSRLSTVEYTRLYDHEDGTKKQYNSTGFGIKPYAGLQCRVVDFPLRLTAGYLANSSGAFHLPGQPDYHLAKNSRDEKLKPDWSGLRLNLSISVPIVKYKKQ